MSFFPTLCFALNGRVRSSSRRTTAPKIRWYEPLERLNISWKIKYSIANVLLLFAPSRGTGADGKKGWEKNRICTKFEKVLLHHEILIALFVLLLLLHCHKTFFFAVPPPLLSFPHYHIIQLSKQYLTTKLNKWKKLFFCFFFWKTRFCGFL